MGRRLDDEPPAAALGADGPRRGRVRAAVGLVVFVYAGLVVAWNVLRFTPVARWAPFELADLFGWLLFLPWPVFALAAIAFRQRRAVAALLLPVIVFSIEYGPQFTPNRVAGTRTIRVVTANLLLYNARVDEIERVIAHLDPDVIALQELGPQMSRELSERLRGRLPYQALYPRTDTNGLGILSRSPLYDISGLQMTGDRACHCQTVETLVEDRDVTFVNAHPRPPGGGPRSFDPERQTSTVGAILRTVRESRPPVVVLGDLNIGDRHRFYRTIREHLGDAHRDAGWGLGLTWGRPRLKVVRIDYVLHDRHWRTTSAHAGTLPGSDHRYVVADLVLRGRG